MRKPMRIVGTVMVLIVIALGGLLARGTARRQITWYWRVNDTAIRMNRSDQEGYLHRASDRKTMIITVTRSGSKKSYWVELPDKRAGHVVGCGDWTAPRLPVFFVSAFAQPCIVRKEPQADSVDQAIDNNPIFGKASVAFNVDEGSRVVVSW